MKLVLSALALFAAVVLSSPSIALPGDAPIDPARLEAARLLVGAMRLEDRFAAGQISTNAADGKLIDDCMKTNTDPTAPAVAKGDCIKKLEDFHQLIDPIKKRLAPSFYKQLAAAAAQCYARLLSTQELNELATFYRSPVGQRFARSAPAFDRDFQAASNDLQLQFMIDVLGEAAKEKAK